MNRIFQDALDKLQDDDKPYTSRELMLSILKNPVHRVQQDTEIKALLCLLSIWKRDKAS